MLVFISFVVLAALTFAIERTRRNTLQRRAEDWLLDMAGLVVQGVAIPVMQTTIVYALLALLLPDWQGSLDVPPVVAFLLNFVLVDYLYYWNHRLLHGKTLWDTHAVHHTAEHLDLFVTSRNTLWASLLIIYVWVNGIFLFLLKDPTAYLLAVSLTASLDLWRHTAFVLPADSLLYRVLTLVLITPNEHAWHHSRDKSRKNFGANLSLWDRLHGTYDRTAALPDRLGIPANLELARQLLFPFPARKVEP
jgi:sterol desaturase/sphingolipid hydroxylase (fatty acid hydroxylase superfamily)